MVHVVQHSRSFLRPTASEPLPSHVVANRLGALDRERHTAMMADEAELAALASVSLTLLHDLP